MTLNTGLAIRARGLTKYYGQTPGLRGIDLEVGNGEFVALVGPSGAGKTTLFRLLNGSLQPTAGEVEVLGTDLARPHPAGLRSLRRRIAVVPQSHGLVAPLTAAQNVLLGALGARSTLSSVSTLFHLTPADRAIAFRALQAVGIGHKLYVRVDSLSGGEQQRVAVARALAQDAELLLADEPVASVDPETAAIVMELLRDLHARGRTVLVSLHQPDLATRYSPRMVLLERGRVIDRQPAAVGR